MSDRFKSFIPDEEPKRLSPWIPPAPFFATLKQALGIPESLPTRRIVIDFPLQQIPIVYVEAYGTRRMVEITQAFEGIDLKIVPVADEPPVPQQVHITINTPPGADPQQLAREVQEAIGKGARNGGLY